MSRDLKQVSATGDVTTTVPAQLHSVTLTASTTVPASVAVRDGSGGVVRLTLSIGTASNTVTWSAGDNAGVLFGTSIHATLTGTGAVASFEFS